MMKSLTRRYPWMFLYFKERYMTLFITYIHKAVEAALITFPNSFNEEQAEILIETVVNYLKNCSIYLH